MAKKKEVYRIVGFDEWDAFYSTNPDDELMSELIGILGTIQKMHPSKRVAGAWGGELVFLKTEGSIGNSIYCAAVILEKVEKESK